MKEEWKKYKERLFPMTKREATYRARIPGLPAEIYIPPVLQTTLAHLDRMSISEIWKRAPPSVKHVPKTESHRQNRNGVRAKSHGTTHWPTLVKCPPTSHPTQHPTPEPAPHHQPTTLDVFSVDSDSDSSSPNAPARLPPQKPANDRHHQNTRMNEVEKLLRTQKQDWQTTATVGTSSVNPIFIPHVQANRACHTQQP